jgi:hypothetical protein
VNVSRRTFLRAGAAASVGGSMPVAFSSPARGGKKKTGREFHFSALQAKVNLGTEPDFAALAHNGQIPGPEIRVKEGEIMRRDGWRSHVIHSNKPGVPFNRAPRYPFWHAAD